MSTSGDQPASRLTRAAGWARKAPAKRIGGPVAGVALAVSGAFGGLAPVQASYDEAEVGETVETGPLDVSVERVRAIDTMSPFASPSEGNRLLVVVLKATNPTDEPVHHIMLTNELDLEVEGAELAGERPRAVRMNDFSSLMELQPSIDYEIGLIYETVGDQVPSEVRIGIPAYTWREDSFTPGLFEWKDPEIAARGAYPVKDVPDAPEDAAQ